MFRTLPRESLEHLPQLANFYDEPMADPSQLPTFAVCREARKLVKVVLSGDGGDELFSGYMGHRLAQYLSKFDVLPDSVSRMLFSTATSITPQESQINRLCRHLALPAKQRPMSVIGIPANPLRSQLVARDIRETNEERFWHIKSYEQELDNLPPVTKAQFYDLLMYLPNSILAKVDRASMAFGLEVRVPILCRSMAELAFRIPEHVRFKLPQDKRVLRRVMTRHFGNELATRKKSGFSIPLKRWMNEYMAQARERKS